ncbi:Bifunctional hemolysin/adenylate cyclase precursor [Pseudovibrio sp. Ad5]|nr:Bifunctional hemolysin/adenylate cyclase precursor [Pseudovibrio sp. Ad5]
MSKIELLQDERIRLDGTASDDVIIGGNVSNIINAGDGNDILTGGTYSQNWQHLRGQGGDDTYHYNQDNGIVWINKDGENASSGNDTFVFDDLVLTDFTITSHEHPTYGVALTLAWEKGGKSGAVNLADLGQHIERYEFADGTSLSKIELLQDERIRLDGTASDDVIIGGNVSNIINAGDGNDILTGGTYSQNWQHLRGQGGDDTYHYNQDNGIVWINKDGENASSGNDTFVFDDLVLTDFTITSHEHPTYGVALTLAWEKGGKSGAVNLADLGQHIERYEFADGSTLSSIEVKTDGTLKLTDTLGDDIIKGGDGNQQIIGRDGNDTIFGGDGNDQLYGGAGRDKLYGNEGNDTLNGYSSGSDYIHGGEGIDTVRYYWARSGGVSVNLQDKVGLSGDAAGDVYVSIENVIGSNFGNDRLVGDGNANVLNGFAGNDILIGGGGNDAIYGGVGDDQLYSDAGLDRLYGNDGNDTLNGYSSGADHLDGGEGIDTVRYYWARSGGVSVNLQDKAGLSGDAAGDIYVSIENVIGSNFGDDHLVGDGSANILNGYGGNDTLIGGNGNDTLIGGQGSDIFVFGNAHFGNDTIKDFATGAGSDDIISIDAELFADFTSVLAATNDVGGDTVIKLDDENSITLKGISKIDLHVDDFQFI